MPRIEILLNELSRECRVTRRFLERLPPDRLDWRPHSKSSTAGDLSAHLVDCLRWAELIFRSDALDFDPRQYQPTRASSLDDLIAAYDTEVTRASEAIESCGDLELAGSWRLLIKGQVRFERPREAAFRDMTLSHMVHHRGQLSVYLRLLDVSVPGAYGPTADER